MTKLRISLSEGTALSVLRKIAKTILSDNPGRESGTYSGTSCYGKLAWFLRDPKNWNDKYFIMLFGTGDTHSTVAHACLYDDRGGIIVDTFSGTPKKNEDGSIVYHTLHTDYLLIASITLARFKKEYLHG